MAGMVLRTPLRLRRGAGPAADEPAQGAAHRAGNGDGCERMLYDPIPQGVSAVMFGAHEGGALPPTVRNVGFTATVEIARDGGGSIGNVP